MTVIALPSPPPTDKISSTPAIRFSIEHIHLTPHYWQSTDGLCYKTLQLCSRYVGERQTCFVTFGSGVTLGTGEPIIRFQVLTKAWFKILLRKRKAFILSCHDTPPPPICFGFPRRGAVRSPTLAATCLFLAGANLMTTSPKILAMVGLAGASTTTMAAMSCEIR